jgi:DNA-binding MarR family transcriptional regulator
MSGGLSAGGEGEASVMFEPLTAGHLFFLLHHLVRQRENALGRELARTGLTLNQWQVLATLRRLEKASMGEVAAFCATDRTTLTRTVDRMVDDGLVQRDRDLVDRRQVHLDLTEKGREVFQRAHLDVTRFNDRVAGVLDAAAVERMQPMIRQVLVHVLEDKAWVDDLMAFRRLKASGPEG